RVLSRRARFRGGRRVAGRERRAAGLRNARRQCGVHAESGRFRQGPRSQEGAGNAAERRHGTVYRSPGVGDQGAGRHARPGTRRHALGTAHLHDHGSRRLQADDRAGALTLSPAALRVLRAVAATLASDGAADLGDRVAAKIAALPRRSDREELDLLLRWLDSQVLNLLLTGIPLPFTRMSPAQRERCLRGWATSWIGQRRKAFQALKRLTTVTHYTTPGVARAIGYPGPLGPPPNTAKAIRPLAITGRTLLECDVVVVGSGAGGGVVAAELAAAGKDVIVLEKGGYRNEADFTHLEGDALDTMYDAGGLLATSDLGLVVLQGATLGGGTVINYTTSFPTPESARRQWATEHKLPHFESTEFTRSLDAVARRIGVNTDHAKPSGRDQVLIRGLEHLKWHHGLLPRDVRGCSQDDACGYCGMGCRRGAKQSTLITYLQDAAAGGARIVVDCDVRRVVTSAGTTTGVEAR